MRPIMAGVLPINYQKSCCTMSRVFLIEKNEIDKYGNIQQVCKIKPY